MLLSPTWTAAIVCYPASLWSLSPRDQSFTKMTHLELKTDPATTLIKPSVVSPAVQNKIQNASMATNLHVILGLISPEMWKIIGFKF